MNEEMSKAQTSEKKDDGGTAGPPSTLSGNRSGRVDLRREQREQLESNHCENSYREGRRDRSQTSQAQPSEKKKWLYACRLFGTNSFKEPAM
jgi:hypothetical protein